MQALQVDQVSLLAEPSVPKLALTKTLGSRRCLEDANRFVSLLPSDLWWVLPRTYFGNEGTH